MIRINEQPEPAIFDARVRKPGQLFLRSYSRPTQKQWSTHSYWRRVLSSLHSAYGGICSYSCHWIPFDTGADTVEHFRPKSKYPRDAYEWKNYRLVCQLLNSRKGTTSGILDPFSITTGWFIIDFPALLVKPAPGLAKKIAAKVKKTRDTLGLNNEDTCLLMRQQFVTDYCLGEVSFSHLEKRAPFLASQMKAQGYDQLTALRTVMNIFPAST